MQFLEASLKKGGGAFFCKDGSFLGKQGAFFVKVSWNKGKKIAQKDLSLRMGPNSNYMSMQLISNI